MARHRPGREFQAQGYERTHRHRQCDRQRRWHGERQPARTLPAAGVRIVQRQQRGQQGGAGTRGEAAARAAYAERRQHERRQPLQAGLQRYRPAAVPTVPRNRQHGTGEVQLLAEDVRGHHPAPAVPGRTEAATRQHPQPRGRQASGQHEPHPAADVADGDRPPAAADLHGCLCCADRLPAGGQQDTGPASIGWQR